MEEKLRRVKRELEERRRRRIRKKEGNTGKEGMGRGE